MSDLGNTPDAVAQRQRDTARDAAAIKAGDVLPAESAPAHLEGLARASLAAFVADGGDKTKALAAWRAQGLASIADAIDPPQPDKSADPPQPDATSIEGAVS